MQLGNEVGILSTSEIRSRESTDRLGGGSDLTNDCTDNWCYLRRPLRLDLIDNWCCFSYGGDQYRLPRVQERFRRPDSRLSISQLLRLTAQASREEDAPSTLP
ncbi:hypothetical protein ACFX2I_000019 [Malus domestica]